MNNIKKSYLYTKRGDKGYTDLYTGQRLKKCSDTFHVLGGIDKLNVCIGDTVSNMYFFYPEYKYLQELQKLLLKLGSSIGSESEDRKRKKKVIFEDKHLLKLEKRIDTLTHKLPKLKTFILPSGVIGSKVHMCRVVTRETERHAVAICDTRDIEVELKFINRLSDYFFESARFIDSYDKGFHTFILCVSFVLMLLRFGLF